MDGRAYLHGCDHGQAEPQAAASAQTDHRYLVIRHDRLLYRGHADIRPYQRSVFPCTGHSAHAVHLFRRAGMRASVSDAAARCAGLHARGAGRRRHGRSAGDTGSGHGRTVRRGVVHASSHSRHVGGGAGHMGHRVHVLPLFHGHARGLCAHGRVVRVSRQHAQSRGGLEHAWLLLVRHRVQL